MLTDAAQLQIRDDVSICEHRDSYMGGSAPVRFELDVSNFTPHNLF